MAWVVKGDGTAEFRGQHSCRVEFQLENTATGEIKRERKTIRIESRTKREKARCKREFRAELESGVNRDFSKTTFREYSLEWLKGRKADPQLSAGTYMRDENRVETINLHLGDMLLSEITRADVRRFQVAIMTADEDGKAPTVSGRPLSGTTAHDTRTTLKQIMAQAVEDEAILRNPCDGLKAPKVDTAEKDALTPEQVARFKALLNASNPRPTLVAFRLCLFAGLRCGEAAALRWRDFDSDAGRIHVERSLCSKTLEFKSTKTDAGRRTIPLDKDTADYLRRFKAVQARRLLAMGISVEDSCICAKAGTEYMHPANIARSLRRFVEANGLPTVTLHQLRHTYCTLLIAAGVDLKTAQYLMGHRDPATTLKIYTHYNEKNGVKAAAAVGALMDSLPATNLVQLDKPKGRWGIKAAAV